MESGENDRRSDAKAVRAFSAYVLQARKAVRGGQGMTKDYYTVRDIAGQLQVKERSVRQLISTGGLKASKVLNKWIVSANNLQSFIESRGDVDGGK